MVHNHQGKFPHSHSPNRFLAKINNGSKWLYIPAGFLALVWFLVRVIPKPSRASYPCQKVAAPMAFGFIGIALSWLAAAFSFSKANKYFKEYRIALAVVCAAIGMAATFGIVSFTAQDTQALAGDGGNTGTFTPSDAANSPIGSAKGIKPGRVAWSWDKSASTYTGSGYWWDNQYNNQTKIDDMLNKAVMAVANQSSVTGAWDALFKNFNQRKTGTASPYVAGQDIAIKVNLNCNGSGNKIDASPHLVKSLLRQLKAAGVAQSDIAIFDVARTSSSAIAHIKSVCQSEFPNVKYNTIHTSLSTGKVSYSLSSITAAEVTRLPTYVVNAKYYINMAILKRHLQPTSSFTGSYGQTAVTLCGKNMFGTFTTPAALHERIRDWYWGMNKYNPIVDLLSNQYLGQNTVLFIMDALYTGNRHDSGPVKWSLAPFNNDYPKSVLASQDPIAIESVGLDFLYAQMSLAKNADNYLHEAAKIGSPASGTTYKGKSLTSLGVHEHWNNKTDKKYTRNLGTGSGIELYQTFGSTPTPSNTYEAEKAALSGCVVASSSAGYTGTGYADYINASNDYIEWPVPVSSSGSYTLKFRYANGGTTSRPLKITKNGTTVSSSLAFPGTGGWTTWKTVSVTTSLSAGTVKIRATAIGSSGGNLDNVQVTAATAAAPPEGAVAFEEEGEPDPANDPLDPEAMEVLAEKEFELTTGVLPTLVPGVKSAPADQRMYNLHGRLVKQAGTRASVTGKMQIPVGVYVAEDTKVKTLITK